MKGSHRHPFLKSCHYSRKRGMRTGTIVVSHLSALHSTTTTTTTPAGSYLPSYPSIILDASRLGRDPAHNRRHAPMVYHEKYSFANWPEKHTFPVSDDLPPNHRGKFEENERLSHPPITRVTIIIHSVLFSRWISLHVSHMS